LDVENSKAPESFVAFQFLRQKQAEKFTSKMRAVAIDAAYKGGEMPVRELFR